MRITFRLTLYTTGQKCGTLCNETPFNVHHLPLNVLHSQLEEWRRKTPFHAHYFLLDVLVGWKSGVLAPQNQFRTRKCRADCGLFSVVFISDYI